MLVGQAHEQGAAHAGLQVLRGDAGELHRAVVRVDHRRDRDDVVVQAGALGQVLGVFEGVLAGVLRRQPDAVHAVGAQGVDGEGGDDGGVDAAGRPSTTEGMPFLSMKSRSPRTSARQTSSQSSSGFAIGPGRGSKRRPAPRTARAG